MHDVPIHLDINGMSVSQTPAMLSIPKPLGEVIAAFLLTGFILISVVVAVCNFSLGLSFALVPSILWIGIVSLVIGTGCTEKGWRRYFVDCLGAFSCDHFADIVIDNDGVTKIRFGFHIADHSFIYTAIAMQKIESIEWHTGQATDLAGKDMNDWHVALWFDHENSLKSESKKWHLKPDQDVYIIGPSKKKEITVAWGKEVVAFLQHAGAVLVPGKDDCTFVRQTPQKS